MKEFFQHLLSSEFMPHGHCYLWTPSILWLHVISDFIITLSYYSIPVALFVLVRKRQDLSFSWIFVLFALFIFACGTTHLMEIWNVWHGTYRLAGLVKLITAIASVITAVLLWPLIPKIIKYPSPNQLEEMNKLLLAEASERKLAQNRLLSLNSDLEAKVRQATAELQMTLAQKDELLVRERTTRMEAEKANRLKDDFLTTLSHELRTPLNALSSWIEVLAGTTTAEHTDTKAIPILRKHVTKLSSIIDDLLDMNMILTGSLMLNFEPYNLAEVVQLVITNLQSSAEAKNVTITKEFDANLPTLKGDVLRIRQIVWNLVTNAIKFTPSGKRISLSLSANDCSVSLRVLDEGRGIDPAFLPHVFDRFRQESGSTMREYSGLGLGLSIAKQLAELHGASICARSAGIGCGAEFTLTLPITI